MYLGMFVKLVGVVATVAAYQVFLDPSVMLR